MLHTELSIFMHVLQFATFQFTIVSFTSFLTGLADPLITALMLNDTVVSTVTLGDTTFNNPELDPTVTHVGAVTPLLSPKENTIEVEPNADHDKSGANWAE